MTTAAVAIVSARGVPGTGCAAVRDARGRALLLTTHHVLFGRGGAPGEAVYALVRDGWIRRRVPIGRALRGRIGCVERDGGLVFVDCAVASLDEDRRAASTGAGPEIVVAPGAPVVKSGAATGRTQGVLAAVAYADRPCVDGQEYQAPGQLLVRARSLDESFSAPGDSGALLLAEPGGEVLGLMWGLNGRGDGVASPIAPVLATLEVELEPGLRVAEARA
jgi:hypothetical protein